MKASVFGLFFAALIAVGYSLDCSVHVNSAPRSDVWTDGTLNYKIYDLSLVNDGNCDTSGVLFLTIDLEPNARVSQYWNLLKEDESHFAYLNGISSQGQASAGIVVSYNNVSQGLATVNVISTQCQTTGDYCASGVITGTYPECSDLSCTSYPGVCISDGGIPRCLVENKPPQTGTSCLSGITVNARANGVWSDGSSNYQIFDITVVNQGVCPIANLKFTIYPQSGSQVWSAWNLDENYNWQNFGSLNPGATLSNAGLIIKGGGGVIVSQGTISCDC